MSLPSRSEQVKAVADLFESVADKGLPLEEVARTVVEGYHALLLGKLKSPASPARLGMLFKTPLDGKVRRFVWQDEELCWIIGESDSYGWLGPFPGPLLEYCEEYRPRRKRDGKMVELSDEEIEEEWRNPDWKVGDLLSQHQRQYSFEIIAASPGSALLRGADGRLVVDDNGSLSKYYRREIKGMGSGW
jgi:hypothetical protein